MVVSLVTKTKGITEESKVLSCFLEKKLECRVLSRQAYDSIIFAFEGIEIPNVSSTRLDCFLGVSALAVRSQVLKKKGRLLEALIVMEIENRIYKFCEDELRIFAIVLASVLQ